MRGRRRGRRRLSLCAYLCRCRCGLTLTRSWPARRLGAWPASCSAAARSSCSTCPACGSECAQCWEGGGGGGRGGACARRGRGRRRAAQPGAVRPAAGGARWSRLAVGWLGGGRPGPCCGACVRSSGVGSRRSFGLLTTGARMGCWRGRSEVAKPAGPSRPGGSRPRWFQGLHRAGLGCCGQIAMGRRALGGVQRKRSCC